MASEVRIPSTGNAGEDAVLAEWHAQVGEKVEAGSTLLTVETAKSTIDIEAPQSGILLAQRAGLGDEVAEFTVVAIIGEADEQVETGHDSPPSSPAGEGQPPTASAAGTRQPSVGVERGEDGRRGNRRISASPRARRVAEDLEVDITSIAGTGPLGRVLAADVERAAADSEKASPPSPTVSISAAALREPKMPARTMPVRGARKVTARRMHASLSQTAQVTLTRYAKADHMLTWLDRLREVADADDTRPRIGVNDAILYATARVVSRHPEANSWFDWDGIQQFDRVDLGFAVDTEHGLLVPVIRDAHALSVGQVAREAQNAIKTARAGKLQPAQMEAGTFTVSNLGGLGIHWFTPVLQPPQSCILGVGAAHRSDGATLLPLSLTFDHRALDGVAAAGVLAGVADAIEHIDVLDAF